MPRHALRPEDAAASDDGRATVPQHAQHSSGPGTPPLTRRELRARERAEAAGTLAPGRDAVAAAPPPSTPIAAHHDTPHHARAATTKHAGRKAVSMLAMGFVGAIAVATSVPANALLTQPEPPAAVAEQAENGHEVAAARSQTIRGDGAAPVTITRDGFDSKSLEQLVALSHMRIADTFTNDAHGTIQWPFPVGVPISDDFGPRIAPTAGASTFHEGVDFAPGAGTPIHVIADGVVREVDPYDDNGLGVHVIVDHMIGGQLVSSVYGHMRPGSLRVTEGEHVTVAQVLGLVGDTGISTGAHLHFEIRLNGTDPVDPYAWLKAHAN